MPRLTCYGGVGEIGGNKLLLEDSDASVFLDMGQTFGLLDGYFVNPWLMPRDRFGLRDYLALDLVPRIPGLYDQEVLEGTDMKWEPPSFDGVFISHCHFDHIFHIRFVDKEIPIFLGETAMTIIGAWESSSTLRLGHHDYRTFRTGSRIRVQGLEVEPIHVDHSVPGAYGFILHTSEGPVVYTGDIRWHGPHGEMTEDFMEAASRERPLALITEGTRVGPEEGRRSMSEQEVLQRAIEVIESAGDRLVVVTFYPRDIDRMRTFYMAAAQAGREFITSAKTAHLLRSLEVDSRLQFPKVFRDYGARAYFRGLEKRDSWETRLREQLGDRAVDSNYIHEHQGEVVLQLDFANLTELVDIDPKPGGHFIHSKSEPFEEEDIEDSVLTAWLRRFGLHRHQLHASGHASSQELEAMVREMRPRKVVPVHTEHPEAFVGLAEDVVLPEVGRPIELIF